MSRLEAELDQVRRLLSTDRPREPLPSGRVGVVVCDIGGDRCAIPTEDVQEVVLVAKLLDLPESDRWVLGVLDLGGHLVPVIDLAVRLGRSPREPTLTDSIVVCDVDGRLVGLLVDGIPDLSHLDSDRILPPPEELRHAPYVLGVVREERASVLFLGLRSLSLGSALPAGDA